jgi:MFS transporter, CP family, cyanate transporter
MGLRTNNAHQAAALSGMAQCIGYLLAACGPALAGELHEQTGNWTIVLLLGVALAVAMAGLGGLAGRQRTVGDH